jgi:3-mercaptopyruvate sulfurtransferase SseA
MKNYKRATILILALLGVFGACKTKGNDTDTRNILFAGLVANTTRVSTAAELTTESDANYDNNRFGLVTATTLKSWIDNWPANKPAGITGNLVILHSGTTAGTSYIKPATGVLSFDWTTDVFKSGDRLAFRASRDNGIITDPFALPTGAVTDEILQTYGIDPTKDLIVFAARNDTGAGTNASPKGGTYQTLHRALYWLRYWGVDRKNLAVLNGPITGNGEFAATYLTTSSSDLTTPTKGTFTVKSLKLIDNSVLVQPLENVINIVKNGTAHTVPGVANNVFIADARYNNASTTPSFSSEYTGAILASTVGPSSAALFAGHIKGAKFTPWPSVVDQTTGKFKSKAEIAALWTDVSTWNAANSAGVGYTDGSTILHYCRTNARSMVSGLSAFLILGKPSVFYENSMIEWTALSASHTNTALRTLPAGHPFATDTTELTASGINTPGPAYNTGASIAQYSAYNINASATTTRKNLDEDKAYKQQ